MKPNDLDLSVKKYGISFYDENGEQYDLHFSLDVWNKLLRSIKTIPDIDE